MSGLRQYLADYLAVRRALGFRLERPGHLLADFVGYVEAAGGDRVTTKMALDWACLPSPASPVYRSQRLAMVRGFARFVHNIDPRSEVPPPHLLPARYERVAPYIYSDVDIGALLDATRTLKDPLRGLTFHTLIALLACTGLRGSEAMGLDDRDIDWDDAVITVRNTKFGKSRQIPVLPGTVEALKAYTAHRDRLCPPPRSSALLIVPPGARITHGILQPVFRALRQRAGLKAVANGRAPRLHDLRHSFAVQTLIGWYQDGHDVQARLPALATYLGHVDPSKTYWYLSAVPELLALAVGRLEAVDGHR